MINYEIIEKKQQVVINGVANEVTKKELVLACPKCKIALYNSGYEGHLNLFFKALEQQGSIVEYCPCCGQKLTNPIMVGDVDEK